MAVRNNAQSKEADQFLESLIRGDDPKFEPRESAQWAKTFLDSIRRYRAKDEFLNDPEVVGSAERLGRTAAADPYRFFWEFWQNADDAGATKVVFSIDENELVITNNGRSFTSREIHSLLFVASSTKSINPELMGQFGVGSLSLMRLSQNPKYESGNYAFRMGHSYTYPESLDANQAKPYPGTRITAPLVSDIDRDKLIKDLSDRIQNETLMYMKNLTKVVVRDVRNGEDIEAVIRTRRTGDGHSITIGDNRWLRFVRTVVPPHGILRDDGTAVRGPVTITVAREPIGGERHPVCAYFPTQQYHNYPWRFSAPFDVTTGRESLIQSDFNRWLLAEVGRTMVKAAVAKGVGKPSEPWDVVPLERHQDDLLNNVWLGAREAMKDIAWLPTETANVTPDEAVFAETADVLRLVSSADLKNIGEGGRTWVKSIPSDKARPVLKDLGALRVCCHIISRVLEKGPVNRNSEWYLNTLATAIQMSAEIGGENENEIEGRLIEGECILQMGSRKEPGKLISLMAAGRDDRVVCNARSERLATELGSLFPEGLVTSLHRVYRLPDKATDDTDDDKRRVVDQWLRQKSSERTFRYVTRLDPASFIKMFVAERPAPENPEVVSDGLLMFVRRHISSYINDQPERRRSQSNLNLGRALLVEAHCLNSSGVEISGYKPVSEVHIPTDYFTRPTWAKAAEGIPDIWWLNPRYRSELVLQDKKILAREIKETE